ncbi:MAG: YCF48-related protein [Bacteroidota bacterium]
MKRIQLIIILLLINTVIHAQWITQTSGTTSSLWGSYFFSNDTGFVVGNGPAILSTTNGGNTWNTIAPPAGVTQGLRGVNFTDFVTGYAVGTSGRILKTRNRGVSWDTLTRPTTAGLLCVNFISDTVGFIGGGGSSGSGIWRTADSANSWTFFSAGGSFSIFDIKFTNSKKIGYACGVGGVIMKTSDTGTTWSTIVSGASGSGTITLTSVAILNDSTAFVCGQTGNIRKTTNGGATWIGLNSGTTTYLNAIQFINDSVGYAAGQSGLLIKTTDGGITWSTVTTSVTTSIQKIFFTPNYNAYLLLSNGSILKSSTTLPVKLVSFTLNQKDNYNELVWLTAQEVNANRFEIEQQIDAYNWTKIGTVEASNNSSKLVRYNFECNKSVNKNAQNYYRLKIIDNDGTFAYSKILATRNSVESSMKVSPNPLTGNTIYIESADNFETKYFELYNNQGVLVQVLETKDNKGMIDNLSNGIYFLINKNTGASYKLYINN